MRRTLSVYDIESILALSREFSNNYIAQIFGVSRRQVIRVLQDPGHYMTSNNLSTGVFQLSTAQLFIPAV